MRSAIAWPSFSALSASVSFPVIRNTMASLAKDADRLRCRLTSSGETARKRTPRTFPPPVGVRRRGDKPEHFANMTQLGLCVIFKEARASAFD